MVVVGHIGSAARRQRERYILVQARLNPCSTLDGCPQDVISTQGWSSLLI